MATQNSSGLKDFIISGTSLSAYRVVTVNSDLTVSYATTTGQAGIGVLQTDASSSYLGGHVAVALWTKPGTVMVSTTGQPLTAGNTLYVTTSGQLTPTTTTGAVAVAVALETSTVTGDIIEVLPLN